MAQGLRIGEILERTGVTRATVHHYVKEGLLPKPRKTGRSTAIYDPGCVERILLIRGLQQKYRRSLAEVKAMLSSRDSDGIAHLMAKVDGATTAVLDAKLAEPNAPMRVEELVARTGFQEEQLHQLEALGLLRSKSTGNERVYPAPDVQVAICLARLNAGGLDRRHGFEFRDAAIYVDALRDLLQREVALFLEKAEDSAGDADLMRLAATAVEEVTPLVLALRSKLLREVLESR